MLYASWRCIKLQSRFFDSPDLATNTLLFEAQALPFFSALLGSFPPPQWGLCCSPILKNLQVKRKGHSICSSPKQNNSIDDSTPAI
jgi:hypothetical protein